MDVCIGILRFDDRNRYGGEHGVPTTLLLGGKKRWIVECKKRTKLNQWCKVRVPTDRDSSHRGELVEILGPIGDRSTELKAMQLHFSILPCKYPKKEDWHLTVQPREEREMIKARVFSVDNAGTRDIDDALSLEEKGNNIKVLGIHVADVASRVPVDSILFSWSQQRASSAYSMGYSVPMLPPELAHEELSLNQGVERNTLSLFLEIGPDLTLLSKRHARTVLVNADATTYARFGDDELEDEYLVKCRTLLQQLSNEIEAEDLVAWTMIEYNKYFGEILASSSALGLLRAQPEAGIAATYVPSNKPTARHMSLGLEHYAHCSSPIRRFSDLANQHVLFSTTKLDLAPFFQSGLVENNINHLNGRCAEIKRYHATVDAMELAYECRGATKQFKSQIELGDDGACLLVHTAKRRVRVPLHDSYFAEPITAAVSRAIHTNQEVALELCGVLLSGRTRLRARLISSSSTKPMGFRAESGAIRMQPKTSNLTVWLEAARQAEKDRLDEELTDDELEKEEEDTVTEESGALEESYVNQVLGYGIDDFQKRCLRVIVEPGLDLLAMAPTGSGKTAVALMAILQAFHRGQRAAYTSPIKALSNQKYAEFTEWFRGRGIEAHVTLLTGDVKIRAPPGTKRELMICTSEILRNKLVKASGGDGSTSTIIAAARAAAEAGDKEAARALEIMAREGHTEDADPDLDRLGCVVSDEIHYINDVDRGAVWEETLMHMPKDVQMVALSATLKDPEYFLEWIKRVRGRDGKLVVRKDRHVPLHFGGIDAKSGDFRELYCTHDDATTGQKGGKFNLDKFPKLFSREALSARLQDDEKRLAAKQAARAERNAEHEAKQQAMGGSGHKPKKKAATVKPGAASQNHNKEPNFVHECLKLARALDKADKLPGIVFCMSRKLCVQGAHACQSLNLLLGEKKKKPKTEEEEENSIEEEQRRARIAEIEKKREAMHKKHLARYMPELGELEAYRDIIFLLSRGVAYHHSGMLPILREFVELCFQQRLVRLVFATETLAVGVNMPARCVAFTQLDKPDDTGAKQGHRWLRVDEFWQMAGRAGRRGLDTVGYVIYAPTLSVAGLRNVAPVHELNRMLTGSVAPATSQLDVDRPFVLRHMARGHDDKVLAKTLRADELRRENAFARRMLENDTFDTSVEDSLSPIFERYEEIEKALQPAHGMIARAKLSQKEVKRLQREKRDIIEKYPRFLELREKANQDLATRQQILAKEVQLKTDWDSSLQWLIEAGFVIPPNKLTPRGKCAAAFSDGEPLILGTMIADDALCSLSLSEVCAWLCLFIPNRTTDKKNNDFLLATLAAPSASLVDVFDYADELSGQLDKEPPDRVLALLVLEWVNSKDIKRIANLVDPHLLGSFVKVIMRLLSYIDVVREVLLGLGQYEVHNRLDNHADALLAGLVTNESLYLRID